ncbi:MAG: rhamnulokinase, partial [Acidobacteriota bacterium]
DIIAPPSHDTASAVVAVPATGEDWAYLSSGTWSLMGIEVPKPIISEESLRFNFTHEGGYGNRIRFLKNSMGLWILERCRLAWSRDGQEYSYSELAQLANEAAPFRSTIDPDDQSFFNPADMPAEIMGYCRRTSQPCPSTIGECVRCILESLALKYRFILDQINSMRGTRIRVLHVVGGGSQNDLLNQFTAEALGIPVLAGPVEATALGNIVVQAISTGRLADLAEARNLIRKSFELRQYAPTAPDQWEEHYQKVRNSFH